MAAITPPPGQETDKDERSSLKERLVDVFDAEPSTMLAGGSPEFIQIGVLQIAFHSPSLRALGRKL